MFRNISDLMGQKNIFDFFTHKTLCVHQDDIRTDKDI